MADESETPLLPCPFCGGKAEITKHFRDPIWRLHHQCGVLAPLMIDWTDSPERLTRMWNTRVRLKARRPLYPGPLS